MGIGQTEDAGVPFEAAVPAVPSATIGSIAIHQDCQPVIAPDPVVVDFSVAVANPTTEQLGPLTIASATVLDEGDAVVASFTASGSVGPIPPNATLQGTFVKNPASVTPAKGCQLLACGKVFHVVVTLAGPNVPPGLKATSAPTAVGCTH